jgi:hypothetical protein
MPGNTALLQTASLSLCPNFFQTLAPLFLRIKLGLPLRVS